MAFLVEMAIRRRARCMGRIGGDHGGDGMARKMVAEGASIEGTVGDHDLDGQVLDQGLGLGHLVPVTRGEAHAQRIAQRVHGDMELGAQAPARGLIA